MIPLRVYIANAIAGVLVSPLIVAGLIIRLLESRDR